MRRDLDRLASDEFDVLVVGAGIYGVTIAWDAALRGLNVAIIDRGDFGGATSFNSAKTVHGGVRSLQRGAVGELREYVRERRALSRIAPHLVHPLPFVMPTTGSLTRNRLLLRGYFAFNDLLARDRNEGLDHAKHLPASRLLSREETLRLNPLIAPDGVTGGIEWHDCQMYSTDRVALSFVVSACERGAAAANYVELVSWRSSGSRVTGIQARDRLDMPASGTFDIRAKVVVNATGPWSHHLIAPLLAGHVNPLPSKLSKAMNLVTKGLTGRHAVSGIAGSRLLFIAPWRDVSIVGTSHDPQEADPEDRAVHRREVERFLGEVKTAFPRADFSGHDIRLVHRGLLPASSSRPGHVDLVRDSRIRDHREDKLDGLISVVGVRYTTARHTAEEAVNLVYQVLGREVYPSATATTPLVGGDCGDFAAFLSGATDERRHDVPGLPVSALRRLALSYGTRCERLTAVMRSDAAAAAPIGRATGVTRAEIQHAAREEMAVTLADAVLRRTEAGSAGHPGPDALDEAARLMAAELGWDEARTRREIEDVERVYRIEED